MDDVFLNKTATNPFEYCGKRVNYFLNVMVWKQRSDTTCEPQLNKINILFTSVF